MLKHDTYCSNTKSRIMCSNVFMLRVVLLLIEVVSLSCRLTDIAGNLRLGLYFLQ